jgi:hypothetical protein
MAIGSLDQAGRLEQLQTYAVVQVRSGYRPDDELRADLFEALVDEVRDPDQARELTGQYLEQARADWVREAASWPAATDFDRMRAAFAEMEAADIVVLEAIDDHWTVSGLLTERARAGSAPRGAAYFTPTDVWHAVEHGMLEINLWHGSQANVTDSDDLLTDVLRIFADHDLDAHFDEGRIELTMRWHRRPVA